MKLTVEIATPGIYFPVDKEGNTVRENIDKDTLSYLKRKFIGSVPVNIDHDKNKIIGKLIKLDIIGNRLIGTVDIDNKYYDEIKDLKVSPEIQYIGNDINKITGIGLVKYPAIKNNSKINNL